MDNSHQPSKLLSWSVAIAVVIVVNLLFYYLIALVYHEPKFETFCPVQNTQLISPEMCVKAGGQWTNTYSTPQEITKAVKDGQSLGYCDPNFTCQKTYDDAHSVYNRNVFLVLIILSIIIIGVGIFIPVEVLSLGFSWAGVLSLIIASIRYWSDANNISKVIILIAALAILVWLSIKKLRK